MEDCEEKKVLPFHEMELDERILKAIAKVGWIQPTLIQVDPCSNLCMIGRYLIVSCDAQMFSGTTVNVYYICCFYQVIVSHSILLINCLEQLNKSH